MLGLLNFLFFFSPLVDGDNKLLLAKLSESSVEKHLQSLESPSFAVFLMPSISFCY